MPLNPLQQQVVDALIVALETYKQELPPENIKQIQSLVDPNSSTININAFLQEIENYPPDFKAEYDRIKQLMQSEEVSKEKDKRIGIVAETDNLANSDSEDDLYDTPIEEIKASLRRSLEDVKEGRVRPISELWQRIDVE